jgi:hypothetical protein
MIVEKVNALEVFGDDNSGLIYGLQEVELGGYVEWFATEEEREEQVKRFKMKVAN